MDDIALPLPMQAELAPDDGTPSRWFTKIEREIERDELIANSTECSGK